MENECSWLLYGAYIDLLVFKVPIRHTERDRWHKILSWVASMFTQTFDKAEWQHTAGFNPKLWTLSDSIRRQMRLSDWKSNQRHIIGLYGINLRYKVWENKLDILSHFPPHISPFLYPKSPKSLSLSLSLNRRQPILFPIRSPPLSSARKSLGHKMTRFFTLTRSAGRVARARPPGS